MKQSTDELSQALANAQDAGGVPLFLEQAVTDHLATPTPVSGTSPGSTSESSGALPQAQDAGGPPNHLIDAIEQSLIGESQAALPQSPLQTALDAGGCSPDLIAAVEGSIT